MKEICPHCRAAVLKDWDELDAEQKMIVERLPASAEMPLAQRKKHRFCPRCFYEETNLRTRHV